MPADDVPDSTDWLTTPLSALAAVEAALRCQVCKDFFQTPVITTCSHTFCSICIRRALSSDGKCPLCRAPEQELRLRSNWSLEETVEAFVNARQTTLELARRHDQPEQAGKRKADGDSLDAQDEPHHKKVRKSARLSRQKSEPDATGVPSPQNDVIEVTDDDDEYIPEPEDGLVACPVCQRRMKEWQVFSHLETCTGASTPPSTTEAHTTQVLGQSQRQQQKLLERLPALNYSMLKEQNLRKKLAELGISNQGPRSLLERRHKEWITLWNANCDAAKPKKRSELLRDLDVWERTQGGRAQLATRTAQNLVMVKDKEFDGAAWATKHDSSFKDLIASARKNRLEAKKAADNEKPSETQSTKPATALQPSEIEPSIDAEEMHEPENTGLNSALLSHASVDATAPPPTGVESTGPDVAALPDPPDISQNKSPFVGVHGDVGRASVETAITK